MHFKTHVSKGGRITGEGAIFPWKIWPGANFRGRGDISCYTDSKSVFHLLPPPGGYVIIWVCMCVCMSVYVCLPVSTITQEIPNIFIRIFLNAFPIS